MNSEMKKRKRKANCTYLVLDIETGFVLAHGEKYKDFSKGTERYIYTGSFREGIFFWRKVEERFRTLEILGRECAILYWSHKGKANYYCNIIRPIGVRFGMKGKDIMPEDKQEYNFLEHLGII